MKRLALVNMIIGFTVITISASAGVFIAFDLTEIFVRETGSVNSWYQVLTRSAHGHFNLFGILHVLFGLTLSYSRLPIVAKKAQTWGLVLATAAMGPGMLWRAYLGPTESFDFNGMVIGFGTSCGLLALAAHSIGLCLKSIERES